jgi:hypothetical protein
MRSTTLGLLHGDGKGGDDDGTDDDDDDDVVPSAEESCEVDDVKTRCCLALVVLNCCRVVVETKLVQVLPCTVFPYVSKRLSIMIIAEEKEWPLVFQCMTSRHVFRCLGFSVVVVWGVKLMANLWM